MCGARIDEHGPIVVGRDERGGLFGRIIGKAQDHGISLVDGLRACFRILALVFGQRQQLDVLARLEPRANLQARGAGLTLRGTAADSDGLVASVGATVNNKPVNASGTTSWSLRARLKPGINTIKLRSTDDLGLSSGFTTVTVTRR
jgi:hypothetical protein